MKACPSQNEYQIHTRTLLLLLGSSGTVLHDSRNQIKQVNVESLCNASDKRYLLNNYQSYINLKQSEFVVEAFLSSEV